jgi:PEGA domain
MPDPMTRAPFAAFGTDWRLGGMYNCPMRYGRLALLGAILGWTGLAWTPMANSNPRMACGLVSLEVMPRGATTLLDGEALGENIWLISVMPGSHTLEVRKSGFKPFTRDFDLDPGARLKLTVNLERALP